MVNAMRPKRSKCYITNGRGCTIQSAIEKRIDGAGQLRGNEIRSLVADVWLSRIRDRV